MKKNIIILLIGLLTATNSHGQVSSIHSLPTNEQDLIHRTSAIFHPHLLPPNSPYLPHQAICGTPIVQEIKTEWPHLSKRSKDFLSLNFTRPIMQYEMTSPAGHFKVHYNLSGQHAVNQTDDNQNGIPDYVDTVAETFDEVWEIEINQLDYRPPPLDGDAFYDIYIKDLSVYNAYGFTYPEISETKTHSFIEIDNNYSDGIYHTKGIAGLQVSAAHEFYHAIQFGYYANASARWWHELTGVWMEDVVYDDINDYYQYLSGFFDAPHKSLDDLIGLHIWGANIYAHHMEQVYGRQAIKQIWELLSEQEPAHNEIQTIDAGIPGGFASVMPRFAVWAYFTGSRYNPSFFEEGVHYPLVKTKLIDLTLNPSTTQSGSIDHLGMDYIQLPTRGLSGGLQTQFTFNNAANWQLVVILIKPTNVEVLYPKQNQINISNIAQYNEIVFIPVVTSLTDRSHSYTLTLNLNKSLTRSNTFVGDFTGDGNINFADFLVFSGGFGNKPSGSTYNYHLDLNGDGNIDFKDFLIFVSHFDIAN